MDQESGNKVGYMIFRAQGKIKMWTLCFKFSGFRDGDSSTLQHRTFRRVEPGQLHRVPTHEVGPARELSLVLWPPLNALGGVACRNQVTRVI